jgi:hypothetical protein
MDILRLPSSSPYMGLSLIGHAVLSSFSLPFVMREDASECTAQGDKLA